MAKQSNYLRELFGKDSSMVVYKPLVQMLKGDWLAAGMLAQIVFWSDKGKRKDGFFYKKQSEFEKEIMLSPYQQTRIVNLLKDMGIIDTKLARANGSPVMHYKFNKERFEEIVAETIAKMLEVEEMDSHNSIRGFIPLRGETNYQVAQRGNDGKFHKDISEGDEEEMNVKINENSQSELLGDYNPSDMELNGEVTARFLTVINTDINTVNACVGNCGQEKEETEKEEDEKEKAEIPEQKPPLSMKEHEAITLALIKEMEEKSKSYGQSKTVPPKNSEEHRERVTAAIQSYYNKHQGDDIEIENFISTLPDAMREIARAFCNKFERVPLKSERGFWIKEWQTQADLHLSPENIESAFTYMGKEGLTIKSPASVTAIAESMKRKQSSDDAYEEYNEVWRGGIRIR